MAVQILLNQVAKPAGVPGQARHDLDANVPVNISVVGGPFAKVFWAIRDRPLDLSVPKVGSDIVTTPTAPVTTLTGHDVDGTTLLSVVVDSGFGLGARPEDVATIEFYAGAPLGPPGFLPLRVPAFGEKREDNSVYIGLFPGPVGNQRGWATALDFIIYYLKTITGGGVPWTSVLDLAALTALATTGFVWGRIVHVESLDGRYMWVPPAAYPGPTSGLQIRAGAGGSWWFRLPERSARYALQTTWFVDGAGGDDENDGLTLGTALSSFDELFARIAPYGVLSPIGSVTVTVSEPGGPYQMPALVIDQSNGTIDFVGTPTVLSANTFAAYAPSVPATNTLDLATSANGAEVFVQGEVLSLLDSGADAYAVVATVPALAQASISIPYDVVVLSSLPEPNPGDRYERLQLPLVILTGSIVAIGKGVPASSSLRLLNVVGSSPNGTTLATTSVDGVSLLACRELNVVLKSSLSGACNVAVAFSSGGTPTEFTPGSQFQNCAIFELEVSNQIVVDTCYLASASAQAIRVHRGGYVRMLGFSAADVANAAIQLFESGCAVDLSEPQCIYGTGNYVLTIRRGDVTVYGDPANGPALVGAIVDFNYTYTGAVDAWWPPFTDGAVIPVSGAVPTYAVLNAAPYLGNAQHVTNNARFLVR